MGSEVRNNLLSREDLLMKEKETTSALKKANVKINQYKDKFEELVQADNAQDDFVVEGADKIKNIFKSLKTKGFDLKSELVQLISTNYADRILHNCILKCTQQVCVFTFSSLTYILYPHMLNYNFCICNCTSFKLITKDNIKIK